MATHKSNCKYPNIRGLIKGPANQDYADEEMAILAELKAQKVVATGREILELVLADKGKKYPRHWALVDKQEENEALKKAQSAALTNARRRCKWFKQDIGELLPVFMVVSQSNGVDTKYVIGEAAELIKDKKNLDQLYERFKKMVENGEGGIALLKKVVLSCTGHHYKP